MNKHEKTWVYFLLLQGLQASNTNQKKQALSHTLHQQTQTSNNKLDLTVTVSSTCEGYYQVDREVPASATADSMELVFGCGLLWRQAEAELAVAHFRSSSSPHGSRSGQR